MADDSDTPEVFIHHAPTDRLTPHGDQRWPSDVQPSFEGDMALLAWLQSSPRLSAQSTGYICDALLQWAMLGEPWPDPLEPLAGSECDHLNLLEQVTVRLSWRIHDAQPLARKFDLARIARELGNAIRSQRDPEALCGSLERELVHRMPWLAAPPVPVPLSDGRVL